MRQKARRCPRDADVRSLGGGKSARDEGRRACVAHAVAGRTSEENEGAKRKTRRRRLLELIERLDQFLEFGRIRASTPPARRRGRRRPPCPRVRSAPSRSSCRRRTSPWSTSTGASRPVFVLASANDCARRPDSLARNALELRRRRRPSSSSAFCQTSAPSLPLPFSRSNVGDVAASASPRGE